MPEVIVQIVGHGPDLDPGIVPEKIRLADIVEPDHEAITKRAGVALGVFE